MNRAVIKSRAFSGSPDLAHVNTSLHHDLSQKETDRTVLRVRQWWRWLCERGARSFLGGAELRKTLWKTTTALREVTGDSQEQEEETLQKQNNVMLFFVLEILRVAPTATGRRSDWGRPMGTAGSAKSQKPVNLLVGLNRSTRSGGACSRLCEQMNAKLHAGLLAHSPG